MRRGKLSWRQWNRTLTIERETLGLLLDGLCIECDVFVRRVKALEAEVQMVDQKFRVVLIAVLSLKAQIASGEDRANTPECHAQT